MAGRPPIFETPDALISINNAKSLFTGVDFINEKDFCDFIEFNLPLFCKDILGVEFLSHHREYSISTSDSNDRRSGTRRIDFLVKTKCGQSIGIECKAPKQSCELANATGQCLSYISLFKRIKKPINRMVLLSSKADDVIPGVIKQFNLPIEFIIVNKKQAIALDINLIEEN